MVAHVLQPRKRHDKIPLLRRFLSDVGGMAAVEFALVAPILAVLLTGMLELSHFMSAQRRLVEAAHICADLISQESDVSSADLDDILNASRYVVTPFSDTDLKIGIASVRFDKDDSSAFLDWTYNYNGGSVSGPLTKTSGMEEAGKSVIIVSAEYSYAPILTALFSSTVTMTEVGYARPRVLSYVGKY